MAGDSADFSAGAAWIDGAVVAISDARLPVTDWALIHGDATYDVVPVWEGAFFRLEDYLARFAASRAAWRFDIGLSDAEIASALHDMVAASGLRSAYVAMVAARGRPTIQGSRDPRDCANHFYAWCVPYIWVMRPEIAPDGRSLLVARSVRRIPDGCVDQRVKNYHWADFTMGLFEAKDAGFESVVLLAPDGLVSEGPGFNLFWMRDGALHTPARHCLHGVTRLTVLDIAAELGMPAIEGDYRLEDVLDAEELFISTSGGGPTWISRLRDAESGREIAFDAEGATTARIRAAYVDWKTARAALRTPIAYP